MVAEKTEGEVEREFTELMRVILSRYHEEQVWSDKIRSASTYGSLTVLGLNLVVFIMAILFVDPWKRKRLAQTFERKVEEMTAHTQAAYNESTQNVVAHLKKQDEIITQLVETLYASMHPEFLSTLAVEPESKPPTVTAGESGEENVPTEESVAPAPPMSVWDTDLPLAIASSATLAAIMGWVARSWYGR